MNRRTTGQFYGDTNQTLCLDGLTFTDTIYTHSQVDWHYHELPYFTFILAGNLIEGNKRETVTAQNGSLLFHNSQDPHYNIKPPRMTRGFHIELGPEWLNGLQQEISMPEGSSDLRDPRLKLLMYQVFKEVKLEGAAAGLSAGSLLLELLHHTNYNPSKRRSKNPHWVPRLTDLLHEEHTTTWSLHTLADQVGIHPVHLSTEFPKYFHCGLGDYIRTLKMEQALRLFPSRQLSLTEIALQCGFSDQSHFNRLFKSAFGLTPLQYRKLL